MAKLGEMIACNPLVKLEKGKSYNLVDIDSITVGNRYASGKDPEIYVGQSGCHFSNGDTVMARITPCLENGKMAQIKCDTQIGFGSTELFVFRGIEGKTDSDYVYYLMSMPYIRQLAANSMTGASGRQRADLDFIKKIEWDFPSLHNQKKIASVLSAYDNLIENNNKRIKILEQMAENLYKEWFVRFRFPGHETTEFENSIPKWNLKNIGEIAVIKAGGDRPNICEEEPTEDCCVPIFSNGTDNDGLYGFTKDAVVFENSITVSARGTVGFVCLRRTPFVPIVRLLAITPKTEESSVYLLYYQLKNDIVIGNGTSQQQITVPMINRKKVFIPSKDIIQKFTKIVECYWNEIDSLKFQNQNLIKQRDLLLPRLMSGKLAV